ncbi:MAG: hypothetical protein Q9174_000741 [Haloplaca sp. 1 TL-2023]
MMVPRAYSYSSAQGRRNAGATSTKQADTRPPQPKTAAKRSSAPHPPFLNAISPAAPSKPVVIPTRTRNDSRQGKNGSRAGRRVAEDHIVPHDSEAVPPSAAALFAICSPSDVKQKQTLRPHPSNSQKRFQNILEADSDIGGGSLSESSPQSWRVLLKPPYEVEDDEFSVGSAITALGPRSSPRSLSSASMTSLDNDTDSAYTFSSPSTPATPFRRHRSRERGSKSVSSSVPEDCNGDHPLLTKSSARESPSDLTEVAVEPSEAESSPPTRPSLKSNLTSSLRRLRSAARTLSTLTITATPREERPGRATLSEFSKISSERRPLPWAEPPDPALRRYLNPITISPAELHTHRDHSESKRPNAPRGCKASMQMQTYRPGARKSEKASAPPVFIDSSSLGTPVDEPAVAEAATRQREPRENSDFLRVIVLEMNMRKVGKLNDAAPGRARLWLPARTAMTQSVDTRKEIPKRWASISP